MQEQLQHYELMLIVSGAITEDKHPSMLEQIRKNLEKSSASGIKQIALGRKKLAYAIKNLKHGFYFIYEFDLPAKNLNGLHEDFRLSAQILRFLITKKKLKTAEDINQENKIKEGRIKAQLKKEAEETAEEKKAARDANKISLEDLDKKLDEILEEKII